MSGINDDRMNGILGIRIFSSVYVAGECGQNFLSSARETSGLNIVVKFILVTYEGVSI